MASDAEAIAAGYQLPANTDWISEGDDAITHNAKNSLDLINAGKWRQRNLLSSDVLDDLTTQPGQYAVLSGAVATAIGLPVAAVGSFEVLTVGTANVQRFSAVAPVSQVWQRERYANGTVWGPWRRTDHPGAAPQPAVAPARNLFRTAPVAVSLGHGGGTDTGTKYLKALSHVPAAAVRLRVCVRNRNPRYEMADSPAASLAAISIGVATNTTSSAQTGVVTLATGASTGTTGYKTPWVSAAAFAGRNTIIGVDWSSAGTVQTCITTAWTGTGTGATTTGATGAKTGAAPFHIWIEVEVPAFTPVLAVKGDSLSAGVGATNPVYDSPLSQYCRPRGIVPVHFAHSGDSFAGAWGDTSTKWLMYGDAYQMADAVILADGSNDIFGGADLATMQANYTAMLPLLRKYVAPSVYASTILPRTSASGGAEVIRRDYNTYLARQAKLTFPYAAAISNDDETIRPEFDADGIHLNTAGYAAIAATITMAPPTDPTTVTVDNTVGRRAFAWDAANARQQMVYGDTGLRDISALIPDRTAGSAYVHRTGNQVTLYFDAITLSGSGTYTHAGMIPLGFRPAATAAATTLHLAPGTDEFRIGISTAGNFSIFNYITGRFLRLTLTFSTNQAWPATLPGTAVGAPV